MNKSSSLSLYAITHLYPYIQYNPHICCISCYKYFYSSESIPPRFVHRPVVTSQSSAALAWSRARCTCAPERSGGQKVTVWTALYFCFFIWRMYACMHACMHVCMYANIYIYTKTVSDTKRLKLANRRPLDIYTCFMFGIQVYSMYEVPSQCTPLGSMFLNGYHFFGGTIILQGFVGSDAILNWMYLSIQLNTFQSLPPKLEVLTGLIFPMNHPWTKNPNKKWLQAATKQWPPLCSILGIIASNMTCQPLSQEPLPLSIGTNSLNQG